MAELIKLNRITVFGSNIAKIKNNLEIKYLYKQKRIILFFIALLLIFLYIKSFNFHYRTIYIISRLL